MGREYRRSWFGAGSCWRKSFGGWTVFGSAVEFSLLWGTETRPDRISPRTVDRIELFDYSHNSLKIHGPTLLFALLLAAAFSCEQRREVPAKPEQPNILLILADDVGREVLGSYGGTSYPTPHLDQLARTGLRFEHAYSMPVCHPSRICLMTGRYPFRLGHPVWGTFPERWEERTLPQVLKRAGYATAIAGKWQLALLREDPEHPFRLGFDQYCLFGWHEGPRYYQPLIWENGRIRSDVRDQYGPDAYVRFLTEFMERHRAGPFFAFYSMALCHDVTDDLEAPVPFGPRGRYDNFGEMVEAMDQRVGRLVGALDRLGLREKTLIFFTTDNGTPKQSIITAQGGKLVREPVSSRMGERTIPGGKGDLTDAGTRVPTIANWKGTLPQGKSTPALMDFSDLLPTLAELGGAQAPPGETLDGTSFAALLRGEPGPGRDWVFAEHRGKSWVRTRDWKLYRDGRFFDLTADPDETRPVPEEAKTPVHGRLQTILERLFENHRSSTAEN